LGHSPSGASAASVVPHLEQKPITASIPKPLNSPLCIEAVPPQRNAKCPKCNPEILPILLRFAPFCFR
jgi:hypothetical protein